MGDDGSQAASFVVSMRESLPVMNFENSASWECRISAAVTVDVVQAVRVRFACFVACSQTSVGRSHNFIFCTASERKMVGCGGVCVAAQVTGELAL